MNIHCVVLVLVCAACFVQTRLILGKRARSDNLVSHKVGDINAFLLETGTVACPTGPGFSCEMNDNCYQSMRELCNDVSICMDEDMCSAVPPEFQEVCQSASDMTRVMVCQAADMIDWVDTRGLYPHFVDSNPETDLAVFGAVWAMGFKFCDDGRLKCPDDNCMSHAEMCDNGIDCSCGGMKGLIDMMVQETKMALEFNTGGIVERSLPQPVQKIRRFLKTITK
ncbi:uncharacterized protein LOC100369709 [Saccoglossus kowalevskii]|uniref:Uncharacterized protein LOC100369709 n=1 Tax=Saccoglossus kowalevskii TaxID=10224 RepID=A0ABM0GKR5_SACKO|nr:PREDICTED: uncharacterized protein LOC100369709 [Saccoglossus kowalevskii]